MLFAALITNVVFVERLLHIQVECIFSLVKDNKFFAELDAEMSLELCRHMTYTTKKKDRVVFYKGDPGDFATATCQRLRHFVLSH